MSVSAMTNVAYARRADVPPLNEAPTTLGEIEQAKGGTPESRSPATSAISSITTYIPTEILTLYVAVLGALQGAAQGGVADRPATRAEWIAFFFFLGATPVFVWLLYAAKVKNASKLVPLAPRKWPLWEMVAATIGYMAWAFALPNSPFRDFAQFGWYSQALAGVMVLVVSTTLGLIAPIVQRPLPA
jgi:hypothetical protein